MNPSILTATMVMNRTPSPPRRPKPYGRHQSFADEPRSTPLMASVERPSVARRSVSSSAVDQAVLLPDSTETYIDGEQSKSTNSVHRIVKKRNRVPSSCVNCRKRKLRCNRVSPCDQCTKHHEVCLWDGAVPLLETYGMDNEAERLRQQIAQLKLMLVNHSATASVSASASLQDSYWGHETFQTSGQGSSFSSPTLSSTSNGVFPTTSSDSDNNERGCLYDLRANDLGDALTILATGNGSRLEGVGSESWAPNGSYGTSFLKEVRAFVPSNSNESSLALPRTRPQRASSSSCGPTYDGSQLGSRARPRVSDLVQFIPSDTDALYLYRYYVEHVQPFSPLVHLPVFEMQWQRMREKLDKGEEEQLDPVFIATFLGICSGSLSKMSRDGRSSHGLDRGSQNSRAYYFEGALLGLRCAKFFDSPTIESVRAAAVLVAQGLQAGGESATETLWLLPITCQTAMSIGLNRDPSRHPGRHSLAEAEDRRCLFWSLFSLSVLSSPLGNSSWMTLDLKNIDVALPLDCFNDELIDESKARSLANSRRTTCEQTPLSSARIRTKLAILSRTISDTAFSIRPVPYERVLKLHQQLTVLESNLPTFLSAETALAPPWTTAFSTQTRAEACDIQLLLSFEYIRLHRPFLVLAASNEDMKISRDTALEQGRRFLRLFTNDVVRSTVTWPSFASRAVAASIVLSLGCMNPYDLPREDVETIRHLVSTTCELLSTLRETLSFAARSIRVLRFLLSCSVQLEAPSALISEPQHQYIDFGHHSRLSSDGGPNPASTQDSQYIFLSEAGLAASELFPPTVSHHTNGLTAPMTLEKPSQPPPFTSPLLGSYHTALTTS